jgi:hypothetical protein
MRRSIFVGVVVACLVIVGTAVALAQQPSQGSGQLEDGLQSPNEMHSWMTDNWDEMPMFGGSGVVGEDGWAQSHDEMHSWMTDNWDEMPMYGGSTSGRMTDNWDEMPMHGGGSRG